MLWITVQLSTICCCLAVRQELTFSDNIRRLGLSVENHFNAIVGARVTTSPRGAAKCEEGNHCVRPWWLPPPRVEASNLNQTGSSDGGSSSHGCGGLNIACNHTCPAVQYSTPQARTLPFTIKRGCDKDSNRDPTGAPNRTYPFSVTSNSTCTTSLNFLHDFTRSAGFHFQISLNLEQMRLLNDTRFLLLEGKRAIAGSAAGSSVVPADDTFRWTVDKTVDSSFYLSLHAVSLPEHASAPKLLYKSAVPYTAATARVSLFIRHVSEVPSFTCFYVDGLRRACLHRSEGEGRTIAFLSVNNFGHKIVTGSFQDVTSYELGQLGVVLSERQILELSRPNKPNLQTSDCLCQSIRYPFMRRDDWKEFDDNPFSYSKYCFSDVSQGSKSVLRVHEEQHALHQAFDGDLTTFGMTMTGVNNMTLTVTFPRKVTVKGIMLSMAVLPESCTLLDADKCPISFIQQQCRGNDTRCLTWSALSSNVTGMNKTPPLMKWLFAESATTSLFYINFNGIQDSWTKFLLLNEISIIATCHCVGTAVCVVDHTASPTNASSSHHCDCPLNISGKHCNTCEEGFYTSKPNGVVNESSSCNPCHCDGLGTCQMWNGSCLNPPPNTCDSGGRCLCRHGDGTIYDHSNPKCLAELHTLVPAYGPMSGSTLVTLSGKYILGYDKVLLINTQSNKTIVQRATPARSTAGMEQIHFRSPSTENQGQQMLVKLSGQAAYPQGKSDLIFSYRPNPVITEAEQRFYSKSGGLRLHVEGDNLDSSAHPTMLTHLYCLKSESLHDTLKSECVSNRTAMTCITPDMTAALQTMRCIITTRLRRAATGTKDENDFSGIYIQFGFLFDGYVDYVTFTNTTEKISVYDDPILSNLTESQSQLEPTATLLRLLGSRLSLCCSSSDYLVYVGDDLCKVEILTNTKITCALPASWQAADYGTEAAVTVRIGENNYTVGSITKMTPKSIWDSKEFVLTVAVSCTLTFVLAMIISTVICCVYHHHFFHGQTTTKVMLRDVRQMRHPVPLDHSRPTIHTAPGSYVMRPTNYFHGPDEEGGVQYISASDFHPDENPDDAESMVMDESQRYFVRQESTNSYNNRGYYEIEI